LKRRWLRYPDIGAITLPVDVAAQMFAHPAVQPAVEQFIHDWQGVFES
jgi:hypothetical protein